MKNPSRIIQRFVTVMLSPQAYVNLVYSLASFPLGIFYFVFLVTGLALGISLSIIWVGVPLLVLVGIASLAMAHWERFLVIHILREDIPPLLSRINRNRGIWVSVKETLTNPAFWKSPVYLFFKFPLGIASFTILVTFISLTLAFLTLPFTYESIEWVGPGIFFGNNLLVFRIDSMNDALFGTLLGLFLWPITLHIGNGLTLVHAIFAKLMLSGEQTESLMTIRGSA